MKEILCVKCGQPAAFPTAVKEPYTCLTCQRSAEPSASEPPETRAVCSKELLAALWEKYQTAEDEVREIRERLENSSSDYKAAITRSQEAWNKLDAAQKASAANDKVQTRRD